MAEQAEPKQDNKAAILISLNMNLDVSISLKENVVESITIAGTEANAIKMHLKVLGVPSGLKYTEMYITPYYVSGASKILAEADILKYANEVFSKVTPKISGAFNMRIAPFKIELVGTRINDKQINAEYKGTDVMKYAGDSTMRRYANITVDGNKIGDNSNSKIIELFKAFTPFFDIEIFHK